MKRKYLKFLTTWKDRSNRKPLILRGARQVGKTHLIRRFAKRHFQHFIEINFDETPGKSDLFKSSDLNKVVEFISLDTDTPVIPGKTLLFLDEIQRTPELLAKLRYFYEKLDTLHVIAAGSLLNFILEDHTFSMPVGRVEYLFIGPMDFYEFLEGCNQNRLVSFLKNWSPKEPIPQSIHEKFLEFQRLYMAVGGMPAAVREYIQNNSFGQVELEQSSIIQTYQDDFSKYRKKIHAGRLKMTLSKIPHLVGKKLKYVDISREERAKDMADTIRMLHMAGVIYLVHHSSGNALPIRFEKKEKVFKPLFLDTGLMMRSLNMKITSLLDEKSILANHGAIAEQFIGQQLLYRETGCQEPELFYWNREKKGAAAEVDYLFQIDSDIVPVEVKAGTTGSLKSLHVFAHLKKSVAALRFNLDYPSIHKIEAKVMKKDSHLFKLISLPLYMVLEAKRVYRGIMD